MTPKMERALAALLLHPTQKAAAEAAGISDRTLRNYLATPEFQQAYQSAIADLISQATKQAQKNLSPAISVLREILEDKEQAAATRISACRSTLEYGLRLTETTDILQQLRELEQWKEESDSCRQ